LLLSALLCFSLHVPQTTRFSYYTYTPPIEYSPSIGCRTLSLEIEANQLLEATMAGTRGSQTSAKSSPASGTKTPAKRAAAAPSGPPRKRGRPSKKDLEERAQQQPQEEASNSATNDEDMAEENGYTNEEVDGNAKNGNQQNTGRQSAKGKKQQTIEEAFDGAEDDNEIDAQIGGGGGRKVNGNAKNVIQDGEKNAFDEVKADAGEVKKAAKEKQEKKPEAIAHNNNSVIEDEERKAAIPSSVLEKGIIYFVFRARVNIDEPEGVEDVARSYIILRPLPLGAKLGEGPLADTGDARLLVLPKKVLPKSKADRFLVFVEDPDGQVPDLRKDFASSEYATQTSGLVWVYSKVAKSMLICRSTSHVSAATPFACGVYAITSTGRESHLAYHVTYPENMGEVQNELGVREKGSFICSVKNPKAPGPSNASFHNPADYPQDIQKKFRNLRWMPLEPELLNFQFTQMLLIGEGQGAFGHALDEMSKDSRDDEKDAPEEVLEQLEEEVSALSCILWNALEEKLPMNAKDKHRVKHLEEDDPVFADLGLSGKEFSKIQTSWL